MALDKSLLDKILPHDPKDDAQLPAAPFTRDDPIVRWEWPSLLKDGPQILTMEELKIVAVDQFPNSVRRKQIFSGFTHWCGALSSVLPTFLLYIDGGFLTRKPLPDDVDVIAFIAGRDIDLLDDAGFLELQRLFERDPMREAHRLDVFTERRGDIERETYWSDQFGKRYDLKTPKGFAVIEVRS